MVRDGGAALHASPRHSQYHSLMRLVPVRATQPSSGRPPVAHVLTTRSSPSTTHHTDGQCTHIHRPTSTLNHIVNIWNSLPNFVVDVDTVCPFKARLDKFWMHQDVLYDFKADLTGIGDKSVRESSRL